MLPWAALRAATRITSGQSLSKTVILRGRKNFSPLLPDNAPCRTFALDETSSCKDKFSFFLFSRKKTVERYKEISDLLLELATTLTACGSHTSRIVRNVNRAAQCFGCSTDITLFQKNITMTLRDNRDGEIRLTAVKKITPRPIDFRIVSSISSLTWYAYDNLISIEEFRRRFDEIVHRPRYATLPVTLLVGIANACFCRIFTGDPLSMLLVLVGTLVGFSARSYLTRQKTNALVVFIISAFLSSFVVGAAVQLGVPTQTAHVAIGSSVLFLIPGVPLMNGVIDVLEGHVLAGISRLITATVSIVCITIGLSISLLLLGISEL